MNNYTNLNGREYLLESITTLEKELAAKTGKEVALVAYYGIQPYRCSQAEQCIFGIPAGHPT